MVYQWKRGIVAPTANAQRVGEALQVIRDHEGCLPAEAIVAHAEDRRSALHPLFEWDDSRAAHEYRLEQARALVKKITVVSDDGRLRESRFVQAFTISSAPAPKGTKPKMVHGPEKRVQPAPPPLTARQLERMSDAGWAALLRWREEYKDVPAFASIIAAIDRARATAAA